MRTILLIGLTVILSIRVVSADQANRVSLPGSTVSFAEAVGYASDIIIGKFSIAGGGATATITGARYVGKVTVLKNMKGNVSGNLDLSFRVFLGPVDTESVPKVGEAYVMFIDTDRKYLLKILPPTEANIAAVRKLISKGTGG